MCRAEVTLANAFFFFFLSVEATLRSRKMGSRRWFSPRKGPLPPCPRALWGHSASAPLRSLLRPLASYLWVRGSHPLPGPSTPGLPWAPLPGAVGPRHGGGVAALQPTLPLGSGLLHKATWSSPKWLATLVTTGRYFRKPQAHWVGITFPNSLLNPLLWIRYRITAVITIIWFNSPRG